ncbi:uncharacterized protein LOC116342011 isoform X2 [Contarinia nasturtii]|uniref:uncharacterized protein LOC116342011 isoform X2 n=1 Tax=Contarinia nasturtii TaxID=265458 RepID=UPI0012D4B32C|nr:uncharacterized protein LOC116342011 isoform X2 [Contarinia nasturtii]
MKLVTLNLFLILVLIDATKPPIWDSVYTLTGVLNIAYAEIEEPFAAWVDPIARRSRIHYYNGMVKTYQFEGEYGQSFKGAPITTDQQLNKIDCLSSMIPKRIDRRPSVSSFPSIPGQRSL